MLNYICHYTLEHSTCIVSIGLIELTYLSFVLCYYRNHKCVYVPCELILFFIKLFIFLFRFNVKFSQGMLYASPLQKLINLKIYLDPSVIRPRSWTWHYTFIKQDVCWFLQTLAHHERNWSNRTRYDIWYILLTN